MSNGPRNQWVNVKVKSYNAVGIDGTLTPLTFLYQEVAKEARDFTLYTSDDV